jgi:hypothetical protein
MPTVTRRRVDPGVRTVDTVRAMRVQHLVQPTVMPPPRLPLHNLAPMVAFGLLFQFLAAGPWSFAAAAWLCLLPLLVLVRCLPPGQALAAGFAIPFVGRLLAGAIGGAGNDNVVVAAAVIAGLTLVVLMSHRLVMRELPLLGSLAAPCAVVVVEWAAGHWALPGAAWLPLSSTQASDVPFFRWVDLLTPLGISFGVAWGQSAMAGFGEAWLAPDPHSQAHRERGLRLGANLCFWLVVVVGHVGGMLRDDPTSTPTHHLVVVGLAGAALLAMVTLATISSLRRASGSPPPAMTTTTTTTTTTAVDDAAGASA